MAIKFDKIKESGEKLFKNPVFIVAALVVVGIGIYAYKKQSGQSAVPSSYSDQVASQYPTYPDNKQSDEFTFPSSYSDQVASQFPTYAAITDPYALDVARIQATTDQASIASDVEIAKIQADSDYEELVMKQTESINAVRAQIDLFSPKLDATTSNRYTVSIPSDLKNYAQTKIKMEKATGYKFYADPKTGKLSTTATQESLNKILATSPYKAYYKEVSPKLSAPTGNRFTVSGPSKAVRFKFYADPKVRYKGR